MREVKGPRRRGDSPPLAVEGGAGYLRSVSKAFTKDEAWEEPIIPPRAPLPAGAQNYVTPRGLRLLRAELADLEAERQRLGRDRNDELEYRRQLAIVTGRIGDLAARISSAVLVDPGRQPRHEVRFGARVTLRTVSGERAGEERRVEIVGIDEADAAQGRVAFTSPIARAILGRGVGDTAVLDTPRVKDLLEVVSIDYAAG
jgi:transcription elongation factor GreB